MSYSVFFKTDLIGFFLLISTLVGPNTTPPSLENLKDFTAIWPLFKAFEKISNSQSLKLYLLYDEYKGIISYISYCPRKVKS